MLNRQPNKKAVQGFIKGGIVAYVSGSTLNKTGDYIQNFVGELWAYESCLIKIGLVKELIMGY